MSRLFVILCFTGVFSSAFANQSPWEREWTWDEGGPQGGFAGSLKVSQCGPEQCLFELSTVRLPQASTCEAKGALKFSAQPTVAEASFAEGEALKPCRLRFTRSGEGKKAVIAVEELELETCQAFCGLNATFAGKFAADAKKKKKAAKK